MISEELLLAVHETFRSGGCWTVMQIVEKLERWHRSQVARAINALKRDEIVEVVNVIRSNGNEPVIYRIRSTKSAPDVDNNPFLWRTFKQPFPVQGGWS